MTAAATVVGYVGLATFFIVKKFFVQQSGKNMGADFIILRVFFNSFPLPKPELTFWKHGLIYAYFSFPQFEGHTFFGEKKGEKEKKEKG